MRLNYDTILSLVPLCDLRTSMALISACRFLYHQGTKVLLHSTRIVIKDEPQLVAFYRFLSAEKARRFDHVRNLSIDLWANGQEAHPPIQVPPPFPQTLSTLDEIIPFGLSLMHGLTHFELCDAGPAFSRLPSLSESIGIFRTVTHLRLRRYSPDDLDLLAAAQFPTLVSVYCEFQGELWWHYGESKVWTTRHPLTFFRCSAVSLRELAFVNWTGTHEAHLSVDAFEDIENDPLRAADLRVWPPVGAEVVYPNMRDFLLEYYHADEIPLIGPYVHAFPNLERLAVAHRSPRFEGDAGVARETARAENSAALAREAADAGAAWPHLREFVGAAVELYALGILGHVPRLTLAARSWTSASDRLARVLEDTHPVHVECDVDMYLCWIIKALKDAGADFLEVLEVHVDMVRLAQFIFRPSGYIEILSVSASGTHGLITD